MLIHPTVDDFGDGYPKFTALMNLHPAFQNFRRFSRARLRLMLLKQDEISRLETSLDEIDRHEQRKLFLRSVRKDENNERQTILSKMQRSISEYGKIFTNIAYSN